MTVFTKKLAATIPAMLLYVLLAGVTMMSSVETTNPNAPVPMIEKWDKVFTEGLKVDHRKVTFWNRYRIALVGDLYLSRDRGGRKLTAVAVSSPFGAVKEQSSGLYTQTLTEQGPAALSFDPSYAGENDGYPHDMAPSDINTEDLSVAVDFLGLQKEVDRNRVSLLGICGRGGMALSGTAMGIHVKAVATSVMYNMSHAIGHGIGDDKSHCATTSR